MAMTEINEYKKTLHVGTTISIGFLGSVLAFVLVFLFPPDNSTTPPTYSEASLICIEVSMALYIFGCTVIGLKLAEEKKTLPAAGFTMMAIAQGVVFVLNFLNLDNTDSYEETYKTYCGSLYLLLPAMVLIAFYSEYPKWVNWLGIGACIPLIIVYVKFMSHSYTNFQEIDSISFFSMILFNITALMWGLFEVRNTKKALQELRHHHGHEKE